ncbi:MAG: TetR/AcrR family transcriptional regulator [Ornithinimicrobium sp.]
MTVASPRRRSGRLPSQEREARSQEVLDAALAELIERGHTAVTTAHIAARARASKQTLYAWFGNMFGIYEALIQRSADNSVTGTLALLRAGAEHQEVLQHYAAALLTLITSPGSIALNRAAMSSPELSAVLLTSGRHRIGPIMEAYLSELHTAGALHTPDPAAAFCMFYGLVVQDTQIRTLLGEPAPTAEQIEAQASTGVEAFLTLSAPVTRRARKLSRPAGSIPAGSAAAADSADRNATSGS